MITNINQLDLTKTYTTADYLQWRFKERVELIWGQLFKMSPAPSSQHQIISGNLHFLLANFYPTKYLLRLLMYICPRKTKTQYYNPIYASFVTPEK